MDVEGEGVTVEERSAVIESQPSDAVMEADPAAGEVETAAAESLEPDAGAALESALGEVDNADQLEPAKSKKRLRTVIPSKDDPEAQAPAAQREARKPWSDVEDQRLLEAARAHGFTEGCKQGVWNPDWRKIAEEVGSRKPKQCRERIFDNLDPSIDHSPLTEEEEQVLLKLVDTYGTKWAVIANAMPQTKGRRPGNQLKNNWNRLMGKYKDRRRSSGKSEAEEDDDPHSETEGLEPSSDASPNASQKRAKLADGDVETGRNGQLGDGSKAKISARAPPPMGGICQVLRQRLRNTKGTPSFEYHCVWVGGKQADATWETEATLTKVINGLEVLVSAALSV